MTTNDYNAATYGESYAEVYDDWHDADPAEALATLALLARGGRALELGIGTGRLALPLVAQGVEVQGVDASPAMLDKLRAKPGGANIPVTIGDFADVAVTGEFALIYVAINTFFALTTQEEQLRCFRNVTPRLAAAGVFLIEAFVPDVTLYPRGQCVQASRVTTDRVSLHIARHDPVAQRVTGQQVVISEQGVRLYPVQIRYAWPAELDLMAQLAGLRLRQRWSGWQREPFTAASRQHISIYERAR